MGDRAVQTARPDSGARAVYLDETARLIRRRLDVVAALFLLFIGVAMGAELPSHPERARVVMLLFGTEAFACLAAVVACRVPRLRSRRREIATGLAVILASLMSAYDALTGNPAEPLALAHVCLLSGLVVLLPWGWRCQLVASTASLLSFAAAAPHLPTQGLLVHSFVALAAGATTSVWGAFFLERYRRDAFEQSALHREEAEIAETMLHVAQTLNAHLNRPNLLEQVTRLTVEALGCDWSSIYVWDEVRQAFRLRANTGARPENRAEVEQIEFSRDNFPLVRVAQPGEVFEVPDWSAQSLLPPALLQRWEIASLVAMPIARGDQILGSLVSGYRLRTGPFSPKQRRLTLGIGQATALALENARLIADLQAASRLKSEFVSTISHELRTPLNVILGYAEMVKDAELTGDDRQEAVQRIEQAGRELLELIENTLQIGKIETQREETRLEPVWLPAFWAKLADRCADLPRSRDVALEWAREVPAVSLPIDPRKLSVVLANLVGNALKFTTRGVVRAGILLEEDALLLRVSDTGIGIRAEDHETIFEMFRQADGSDSRRYRGTGLGLYIVRRFVEQLGGTIALESILGQGSTFTIALPHAGARSAAAAA